MDWLAACYATVDCRAKIARFHLPDEPVLDGVGRVERASSVPEEAVVRTQDGVLRYRGCLCVLDVAGLRDRIMSEPHYSWYSIHPGSTKMYDEIKDVYWWNDMNKNIAEYVAQYPSCHYYFSIQMAPYEALYGRRCRSTIGWFDVGESGLHGPDLVQQAIEKLKLIRERLLIAQSRQKSYHDVRR
ncbi:PREDICTED: uncharacterized protein LOC109221415 [Nicotiana attenuata]|uniref:uncharacterized protein LOC109221415 n=1 Tax=Nicotiana attenuata TaxID=49451 RepID=UPI0009046A21|nr:PREDICTED: uncharacterized protein LOC109221415 [Nicotiana attenuata]